MRRRAHDSVECGREISRDLVDIFVVGDPEHQDPAFSSINGPQATRCLPDRVGGMADVDDGERALPDDLEPAGPACVTQPGSYGSFDRGGSRTMPGVLQPKQELSGRYRGVVELKHAQQSCFKRFEIMISEPKIKPLPRARNLVIADLDRVADEWAGYV